MSTIPKISTAPLIKASSKITTRSFQNKKQHGEPITMLTAYDYPTSLILDRSGINSILVGDSLGMVVLGYENTLRVTMQDMLHHCRAVARGAEYALLIGDMPFMSYQVSVEEAVRNAGRFLQEGSMDAIKLEGGQERSDAIRAIVSTGIPVMGHLGLTPQSVHQLEDLCPGKNCCCRQAPIPGRTSASGSGMLFPGAGISPRTFSRFDLQTPGYPNHRDWSRKWV